MSLSAAQVWEDPIPSGFGSTARMDDTAQEHTPPGPTVNVVELFITVETKEFLVANKKPREIGQLRENLESGEKLPGKMEEDTNKYGWSYLSMVHSVTSIMRGMLGKLQNYYSHECVWAENVLCPAFGSIPSGDHRATEPMIF
jgi:hypothetical protein